MTDWQPIDSAPRDGTEIILAIPKMASGLHYGYWVHIGWWNDAESFFKWRFFDSFNLTPSGCCDREDDDMVKVNGIGADGPSHWLPLPSPPEPQP